MKKPVRVLSAIIAALVIGTMGAYDTIQKNPPEYQQHPAVCIITDFAGAALVVFICFFASGWFGRRNKKSSTKNASSSQGPGVSLYPSVEETFIHSGDERFYEEVAREMEENPLKAGLWTKAFAEMGGDDAKARAFYIKCRVAQLIEANRQRLEEERLKKQRQEERERAMTEPLTFELFQKEYRGETPLDRHGWYEQQALFEEWRKLRLEARG